MNELKQKYAEILARIEAKRGAKGAVDWGAVFADVQEALAVIQQILNTLHPAGKP